MSTGLFSEGFPFNRKRPDDAGRAAAAAPAAPAAKNTPAAPPPAAPAAPVVAPRRAPALTGAERRKAARQTLVAKAIIRCESTSSTVATGYVSNISMMGIGFHTRKALPPGSKYHIKLELGPMKWSTRLRVVSCREHESGTWDVGAEFVGNDLSQVTRRELKVA